MKDTKDTVISVTGLGYVGLPLAIEFAKKFEVIGFDINQSRVDQINQGSDPSNELDPSSFENVNAVFTTDPSLLAKANFHIIGVPTDINKDNSPNLIPLKLASETIGSVLKKGDIVVYESTVFPGCTEEICIPILEKASSLKYKEDFNVGYSPERIVPGDKTRPLTKILKIVSGGTYETTETVSKIYEEIITAGIFKAASIKVAEAAKVIENTQRDLNISLMNELAIIFDKLDIDIQDVVEAAGTKWNFHKYYPGLVGGHCIGVDPYYLIYKAKEVGIVPEVIAAGRRINNSIPTFIASKLAKKLIELGKSPGQCNVLLMGVTFKENVSDIRNSKVFDLIKELQSFSMNVDIMDPYANTIEVKENYDVVINSKTSESYDAIIVCVAHNEYKVLDSSYFKELSSENGILFDIKGLYKKDEYKSMSYWKL